ncbi:MAG: T9SS type A sorting domain-containing protein [Melioribacteraceae bacterium]|nr:T9SS type A sorting domain-containing protein [Melioribacteraceae bacterium]MCF8396520.1 T9SS type A sorting domain-containing protein [Melioribacteraceae bacterium]
MKFFIIALLFFTITIRSQHLKVSRLNSHVQSYGEIIEEKLTANNFHITYSNSGSTAYLPSDLSYPCYWTAPSGIDWWLVLYSGLFIGAKVNDSIRISGVAPFGSKWQPGKLFSEGQYDTSDSNCKIWKIKRSLDLVDNLKEKNELISNYYNWPTQLGALWNDINNDSYFSKNIDEPLLLGEETLFNIMNDDVDTSLSAVNLSKSSGLEITQTIFTYNNNYLDDVVFYRYQIINKGNHQLNNAYISMYAFVEIGNLLDDILGCDSTLNLSFGYNAYARDFNHDGDFNTEDTPPAVGHILLQGPLVPAAETETGILNGKKRSGYKNLDMTAFSPIDEDSPPFGVPFYRDERSLHYTYNLQKGLYYDGRSYFDPVTNKATTFPLNGDPESESGWLQSMGYGVGEQSYILSSGPFNFAPGDTQEVFYALIADQGVSNLNSVTKLKQLARNVTNFFNDSLANKKINYNPTTPEDFEMLQNYPNPFNNVTNIIFRIPHEAKVKLEIFNSIGQKLLTLVDRYLVIGNYSIPLYANNFSSGIYYYRILSNEFSSIKKMIVIK